MGANLLKILIITGFVASLTSPLQAQDSRGELLYTNHCGVCHTPQVHQRGNRKAMSKDDILVWVIRWHNHLKLNWSINDAQEVVEYLNDKYYGFGDVDKAN